MQHCALVNDASKMVIEGAVAFISLLIVLVSRYVLTAVLSAVVYIWLLNAVYYFCQGVESFVREWCVMQMLNISVMCAANCNA